MQQAPPAPKTSSEILASLAQGNQQNVPSVQFAQVAQPQPILQNQGVAPSAHAGLALTAAQMALLSPFIPPHMFADPVLFQARLALLQGLAQNNIPQADWPLYIAAQEARDQAAKQQQFQPPQQLSQQVPRRTSRDRSRSPQRTGSSAAPYRNRSPVRQISPSTQQNKVGLDDPKWIGFDRALPTDHIKGMALVPIDIRKLTRRSAEQNSLCRRHYMWQRRAS